MLELGGAVDLCSTLARGAVAPSGLLPDVVWGCSDFLLVTLFFSFG
jgi:hypothetical protein